MSCALRQGLGALILSLFVAGPAVAADLSLPCLNTTQQPANTWRATCGGAKVGTPYGSAAPADLGFVLFSGGSGLLRNAQVFSPTIGQFVRAPLMGYGRLGHTLTTLPDNRVLVAGGGARVAEVFSTKIAANVNPFSTDPSASVGSFVKTGMMMLDRAGHTATLLANGKVLLAGGGTCGLYSSSFACTTATAELFDPNEDTFTPTGALMSRLTAHTATRLADGRVLIAGGTIGGTPTDIVQIYNPTTGLFSYAGTMTVPRSHHQAVALTDGRVVLAGGDPGHTLEIYNPVTKNFSAVTARLTDEPRMAALLTNGNVLLIPAASAPAKLFNPVTRAISSTGPYASWAPAGTVGVRLIDGKFLMLDGGTGSGQVYHP